MLRAPKSAAALLSEDKPTDDRFVEATMEASGGAFGSTAEFFTPETAA
jgi:hypothetical protein